MRTYKLKELLSIKNGKDHKELDSGKIPVYGSGGIMRYGDKAIFNDESILLPRKGTLSNIQYVKGPFWTVDTIYYSVINKELANPFYLFNFLKLLDLSKLNTGTGVPSMTFDSYYNLDIQLPVIERQKKIASILSAFDSKIKLNNSMNAEIDAMAKLLYDYWFVQFDFPDKNGKPYKTCGGKMEWNKELNREIPQGWKVQKMSEWISVDKSGDWGKEEKEGNFTKKVICFRGTDINGLNGLDELKPPVRYILEKNSFKILKSHDLIIEISGGSPTQSTGRLAFMTDATIKRFEHPLICSNFCKPVSMRNKKLLYNFVYYWNSLYNNGVFFGYEGKTSGIKNLLFESFINSHYIVVPDDSVVENFYNIMNSIQAKKQIALAENQKLAELRDWLLPMLMNGQVTVSGAIDQIETVTTKSAKTKTHVENKISLPIPDSKKGFAKQVLGGKIVSLFKDDPNFTHIKFQKLQFLAEHIAEADLNLNYYFQAAGPHDGVFMNTISSHLKRNKWFEEKNYKYFPLANQDKIDGYFQGYFSPVTERLTKLFSLLKNATEGQAEIIATLYAVWNNRIILKQPISDEDLITDFYNWSSRKQQYKREQITEALKWIRKHEMQPKGFGNEIKRAKKK